MFMESEEFENNIEDLVEKIKKVLLQKEEGGNNSLDSVLYSYGFVVAGLPLYGAPEVWYTAPLHFCGQVMVFLLSISLSY